jgi:hypothetical protein
MIEAGDAQRMIQGHLDQLADDWEVTWVQEESRIPHPERGWAFGAKRVVIGAYGEGAIEHGFLRPDGDIVFDL